MDKKQGVKNIVLGVTGSIAAYKACEIIRAFQEGGAEVTVVMTEEAKKFITPLTLASLSRNRVYLDMFEEDFSQWEMEHISLADKADVLLVAPATANVIAKIAHGIADDLLTCVAMTTKAPVLIAPAMNTGMFNNPLVQKNISLLKSQNVQCVGPKEGKLACGTTGMGHLADVKEIVSKTFALLKNANRTTA